MAILANQKVLTLDYWKPASKIEVGDVLFNKDGQPVIVKLIQEYRSERCYEVIFNDWLSVKGDQHLAFLLENKKYRDRARSCKKAKRFKRPLTRLSVETLLPKQLKNNNQRLVYSVPTTKPLALPHQDLPVPPFLFGFWFFNRRANKTMASPKGYAKEVEANFKDYGYKAIFGRKINTGEREFSVYPTIESQLPPKFSGRIPANYLLASEEQRIELLRGIIHAKSRQYSKTKDAFRITERSNAIIKQIQGLVESLGCRTSLLFDDHYKYYTLFFKTRLRLVENQVSPPIKIHQARRYVTKISELPAQMCVHIETTGQDNTILVGEGFISCL
jgi:replicative DNA helicase